jgi:hypothetical protein
MKRWYRRKTNMELSDLAQFLGKEILAPAMLGAAFAVFFWFKSKWQEKKKQYSIKITAEKNDRIQEILLELRFNLRADRAYLGMFHNGSKYIEGSEILKMSRTNESVAPGISFEAQNYQNTLISLIPDEIKLITDDGPSFTLVSSLSDGKFKRMCETRGIKAVARCAIRTGKDIIGFIGIDYNRELELPVNIEELCRYAGILEQVLTDFRGK